jgi:hypothetical protein
LKLSGQRRIINHRQDLAAHNIILQQTRSARSWTIDQAIDTHLIESCYPQPHTAFGAADVANYVFERHSDQQQMNRIQAPAGAGGGSLEEIPVPDGLDYDLYIGPAPMKPCTKDRITSQGSWHCADYAIGFIAGWGAHPLDISIWGLDYDQQGPFKIRGTGTVATPDALFNTITTWDVQMEFAGGIKTHFMSEEIAKPIVETYRKNWAGDGTTFFGPKGWVSISRDGYAASNPEWFREKQGEGAKRVLYQNNYYRAFVDAVRERTPSVAPIGDAVRSDALSHLSVLAIQSGGEVVWDPKAYRIVSPQPLNERMSKPIRGDWKQS